MKKSITIPLVILVVASVIYGLNNKNEKIDEEVVVNDQQQNSLEKEVAAVKETKRPSSAKATSSLVLTAATEDDKKNMLDRYTSIAKEHRLSLLSMIELVNKYGSRETNRENLITELKSMNLRPQNRKDENPYTGTLNIVRTQNTLPGTRYFHAQFFSNEDGSEFLQHVSFEFAPGEQSLAAVVTALADGREDLEVTQNKENFKSWRTNDGYIIWAKVLEASDLEESDPFNAYKPSDAGIIRVAKELDIHDHAPAFHAEQGPLDQTQEH